MQNGDGPAASFSLEESGPQSSRFYDRLLAALIRRRFAARPLDFALPLLLLREAPLLATGYPERELAALGLQRDFKYGLHALLPAVYLCVMAILSSSTWNFDLTKFLWAAAALSGLLGITAVWLLISSNARLASSIYARLQDSDIVHRLAVQDEQLEDIYAAVPDLLRPVFMPLRRSGMDSHLALVAFNLDWFLYPRRYLLRLNWVCELLLLPFAVGCWLYAWLGLPAGAVQTEPFVYAMAMLAFAALLVSLWARRRTEVFMEALIVHLREQLET